jgi:hypothetical protein
MKVQRETIMGVGGEKGTGEEYKYSNRGDEHDQSILHAYREMS